MRAFERVVSTHSRPKAAASSPYKLPPSIISFNTQPPEGGCVRYEDFTEIDREVSTHSRPKAAALGALLKIFDICCFNTQPPEGGCQIHTSEVIISNGFNTQPPEGGCVNLGLFMLKDFSFNTQPPEGGCGCNFYLNSCRL